MGLDDRCAIQEADFEIEELPVVLRVVIILRGDVTESSGRVLVVQVLEELSPSDLFKQLERLSGAAGTLLDTVENAIPAAGSDWLTEERRLAPAIHVTLEGRAVFDGGREAPGTRDGRWASDLEEDGRDLGRDLGRGELVDLLGDLVQLIGNRDVLLDVSTIRMMIDIRAGKFNIPHHAAACWSCRDALKIETCWTQRTCACRRGRSGACGRGDCSRLSQFEGTWRRAYSWGESVRLRTSDEKPTRKKEQSCS